MNATPSKLTLLVASFALLSCAGDSRTVKTPASNPPPQPWFCETAANPQDWACVQSDQLARQPRPTRSPPYRETANSAPSRSPVDPLPPVRQPAAPEQVQPEHVELAYQPPDSVSLHDIPGDYFAVQIIALSSKQDLEKFATTHNMQNMSAARIAVGDEIFYILLLGVYETRAQAEQASTGLPAPFDRTWIRSVRSLQQAMRAADLR